MAAIGSADGKIEGFLAMLPQKKILMEPVVGIGNPSFTVTLESACLERFIQLFIFYKIIIMFR